MVVFPPVFLQEPAANFPPAAAPSGSIAEATVFPGHPQPITLSVGTLGGSCLYPARNSSNEQICLDWPRALRPAPQANPFPSSLPPSFDRMWSWIATCGNHAHALSSEEGDKGKNRDTEPNLQILGVIKEQM